MVQDAERSASVPSCHGILSGVGARLRLGTRREVGGVDVSWRVGELSAKRQSQDLLRTHRGRCLFRRLEACVVGLWAKGLEIKP